LQYGAETLPVGTLNYADYKYLINRNSTNMRLCRVFADPVTFVGPFFVSPSLDNSH